VTVNILPAAPSVTYNSPAIICKGGAILLSNTTSTNVTFQWLLNNNPISGATISTFSANSGGIYKQIITDLTTNCTNSSQNVWVGEMPNIVNDTIKTCGISTTLSLTNPNFSYSSLPASCSVDMSGGNIVNTNIGGNGGGSRTTIICYGGRLTNQGGSNKFVVEYGGTIDFSGSGSNTVYVKNGGICNVISSGGGGNIIYYEPGAIINPTGLISQVQCNNIGVIYPTNTAALCNNLTYQWSTGATTPTINVNPTQPTTYSVTVSNGSISCTDNVFVAPSATTPIISAGGNTTFCQGGSVVLSSSSATGNTWSNGATTQSITVTSSGSYSVTVSNGNCTATSTQTIVTVNPVPTTPTISAVGNTTFCQGGSVVLTSSSATGNTWSNGATTQSITVTIGGSYSVTVSNGNCSAPSATITATVNPVPTTPTISTGGNTTFCQGGSVVLTSSSATGNTWSNGATTQSITVTSSGSYSVTVSNGNCTATSTQTIVTANPVPTVAVTPLVANLGTNSNAIFNASTSISANFQWQSNSNNMGWSNVPNNSSYSGVTTNSLIVNNVQLSNHLQPFRVIASSGSCVDTSNVATISISDTCINTVNDTIFITVTDTLIINATTTGLTPPNNVNTLKVYPNPASTYITIDYGNYTSMTGYTLKIVNSIGQIVFTTPINQQTSYIDLSTWSGNGIYFVQIIDPQNTTIENRKIVIQ